MHLAIKVTGEPNYYPDFVEVEALPPYGTRVILAGREFRVTDLLLKQRPGLVASSTPTPPDPHSCYYTATLTPAPIPDPPSQPLPEFRRIGPHPPTPEDEEDFQVIAVETPREGGGVHFAKAVIWHSPGRPQQQIEAQFQLLEQELITRLNNPETPS